MLKINNFDFDELPQAGRTPTFGYTDEYTEKTMISGKVRRIYKGCRFTCTFSVAYLLDTELAQVKKILNDQQSAGAVYAEIATPYGDTFEGWAILTVNSEQTRFKYNVSTGEGTWVNWSFTLKATDLTLSTSEE